jgi:hypothetical protein
MASPFTYDPAKAAVATLRAHPEFKISKDLKADIDRLTKLEVLALDLRRNVPDRGVVLNAIARTAVVDVEALQAVELHPLKVAAVEAAKEIQTGAVYDGLRREARAIVGEVRRLIYQPALDKILSLSERVTAGQTPADLSRAGHPEWAAEYVATELELDRMSEGLSLRTALFGAVVNPNLERFHSNKLDQFQDPAAAAAVWTNPAFRDGLASMLAAIQNGAKPWCPLPSEVDARRAEYIAEAQKRDETAREGYLPPLVF